MRDILLRTILKVFDKSEFAVCILICSEKIQIDIVKPSIVLENEINMK